MKRKQLRNEVIAVIVILLLFFTALFALETCVDNYQKVKNEIKIK